MLLIVPLGVLGAVVAAEVRGLPNDVYFKIGLITIIGLAAKNAILIVEFAVELQRQGKSLREAVVEAGRLRMRPILMTSFAFILGVLPLAHLKWRGRQLHATRSAPAWSAECCSRPSSDCCWCRSSTSRSGACSGEKLDAPGRDASRSDNSI